MEIFYYQVSINSHENTASSRDNYLNDKSHKVQYIDPEAKTENGVETGKWSSPNQINLKIYGSVLSSMVKLPDRNV